MIIKGRQWYFNRCLIALSALFLSFTIGCSYATAQNAGLCSVTGNVVDQKGNSVPGAFVELIMNGSILKIDNNPQLSGDGRTKPFGAFNFTGLAPGEYTVITEVTTPASGTYNDSVSVRVVSGMTNVEVKLAKYVYAYSTPTPTPVPTPLAAEENTITITPEPFASQSNATTGNVISGFFKNSAMLLMAGMFSLIIVGGAGVFTISSRSGQRERDLENRAPGRNDKTPNDHGPLSVTGAYKDEYEEDITGIIQLKKEGKIAGNGYYQQLNEMAEKYEIDQSTIMYDISKRMKAK